MLEVVVLKIGRIKKAGKFKAIIIMHKHNMFLDINVAHVIPVGWIVHGAFSHITSTLWNGIVYDNVGHDDITKQFH